MTTLSTTEAQEKFSELLRRVAADKERIILTQAGEELVAVISIEDLALVEALEDRADLEEAREALRGGREKRTTSLADLKARCKDAADLEIINFHAIELNEQAADVLEYQVIPDREPFAALRALSGTAHSDFTDLSMAEAIDDNHA